MQIAKIMQKFTKHDVRCRLWCLLGYDSLVPTTTFTIRVICQTFQVIFQLSVENLLLECFIQYIRITLISGTLTSKNAIAIFHQEVCNILACTRFEKLIRDLPKMNALKVKHSSYSV